jgi:hypothetical protein
MRLQLMAFIESHRAKLERRHYVVQAYSDPLWFYFTEGILKNYLDAYGDAFCLVVDGSPAFDHAYILPYKDFKDFFSPDLFDENRRWACYIRAKTDVLRLSYFEKFKERSVSVFHNAFHLLQETPEASEHSRPAPDINSMI